MIDWGQIFASIFQMLGMCAAGALIGGVIYFLYNKFVKKEEGNFLIVFFPALAGLSFGLLMLSIELGDMGAPEFVFWIVAVPAYIGVAWSLPVCFIMFILVPAIWLFGKALNILFTGLAKSSDAYGKNKGED